MANVYLPLGYPLLSGEEYTTVIYQGTVARLYVIPADPRTDAQVDNRNLFRDFAKVRSSLGEWGRGALRAALGAKWASILYQLAKADSFTWWSDSLNQWSGLSPSIRAAWNQVAPYQATFNEPGEVWFRMCRLIANALEQYSGDIWQAGALWLNDSGEALDWWQRDLSDALVAGKYDDDHPLIVYVGTWGKVWNLSAYGFYYAHVESSGEKYLEFHFVGRYLVFGLVRYNEWGPVVVTIDSVDQPAAEVYASTYEFGTYWVSDLLHSGLHHCRIRSQNAFLSADWFEIRKTARDTTPWIVTDEGDRIETDDGAHIIWSD